VATREALAVLFVARGRRDEALAQLAMTADELRKLAADRLATFPVADNARTAAAIYETLGKSDLAAEMTRLADSLRPFNDGGPPRGMGPGGRDSGRMRPPFQRGNRP
jgi:hypothetical protein